MTSLFDPIQIGNISLSNRIAMAPLTRNRSPGAVPNDLNVTYYEQRASAGLLISEGTPISHQGQGYAQVPGLYLPESIEGWKRVTSAVHAAGGHIAAQLWHVGRVSHTSLQPNGGQPVAPSAIRAKSKTYIVHEDGTGGFVETSEPRALALDEIPGILEDYRRAARAAIDAGFDAVEIHAANGYLIDQFLRSNSNTRTDAYGGSIENRIRLLGEVTGAIADAIGAERTGVRISPNGEVNGTDDSDPEALFAAVGEQLADIGIAFLEAREPRYDSTFRPANRAPVAPAIRKAFGGPFILNSDYTLELGQATLDSGAADAISFGRPFIANPDLPARFRNGLPLARGDSATFYSRGAEGYVDYPAVA